MLQNLTNFFNLIRTRKIKTQLADNDLIAIGTRDNTWEGKYQPTAITFEDLAAQIGTGTVGPTGPQGPAGPQGVPGPVGPAGLTWQGLWTTLNSYAENDAVSFGGASYFCYNPAGVLPGGSNPTVDTANWALLASQGATGPQGPQGIQGPVGSGSPSFASTGSFSTNSLTNVILTSILIPANTYSSTDAFTTALQITKPAGFNGFGTLHVNTVNSLVGASQLATVNGASTSTTIFSLQRTYYIDGLNTYSFPVTTNNVTDVGQSTNAPSTITIDWTQNQYIIVAGRVDNAAFSVTCRGIRIY